MKRHKLIHLNDSDMDILDLLWIELLNSRDGISCSELEELLLLGVEDDDESFNVRPGSYLYADCFLRARLVCS
jgi:hypothetical protein